MSTSRWTKRRLSGDSTSLKRDRSPPNLEFPHQKKTNSHSTPLWVREHSPTLHDETSTQDSAIAPPPAASTAPRDLSETAPCPGGGDLDTAELVANQQKDFMSRLKKLNMGSDSPDTTPSMPAPPQKVKMEESSKEDEAQSDDPGISLIQEKILKALVHSKEKSGEGSEKSKSLGFGSRWTTSEDTKLRKAVKEIGPTDWKRIASEYLGGRRTEIQCLHRWQKVLQPGLVKGPWTAEEDAIIVSCMKQGITKWSKIAEQVPGRIGKQCRERWFNHLDPNLKKGRWTTEEDKILSDAQQRWGNSWTKIAKLLPGRSENAVKNRWNTSCRRKTKGGGPDVEDSSASLRKQDRPVPSSVDCPPPQPTSLQKVFSESGKSSSKQISMPIVTVPAVNASKPKVFSESGKSSPKQISMPPVTVPAVNGSKPKLAVCLNGIKAEEVAPDQVPIGGIVVLPEGKLGMRTSNGLVELPNPLDLKNAAQQAQKSTEMAPPAKDDKSIKREKSVDFIKQLHQNHLTKSQENGVKMELDAEELSLSSSLLLLSMDDMGSLSASVDKFFSPRTCLELSDPAVPQSQAPPQPNNPHQQPSAPTPEPHGQQSSTQEPQQQQEQKAVQPVSCKADPDATSAPNSQISTQEPDKLQQDPPKQLDAEALQALYNKVYQNAEAMSQFLQQQKQLQHSQAQQQQQQTLQYPQQPPQSHSTPTAIFQFNTVQQPVVQPNSPLVYQSLSPTTPVAYQTYPPPAPQPQFITTANPMPPGWNSYQQVQMTIPVATVDLNSAIQLPPGVGSPAVLPTPGSVPAPLPSGPHVPGQPVMRWQTQGGQVVTPLMTPVYREHPHGFASPQAVLRTSPMPVEYQTHGSGLQISSKQDLTESFEGHLKELRKIL